MSTEFCKSNEVTIKAGDGFETFCHGDAIYVKPKWEPIDTAPKDKPILGTNKGYVYEMQWSENLVGWLDPGEWEKHPTHWMPLPKPPKWENL